MSTPGKQAKAAAASGVSAGAQAPDASDPSSSFLPRAKDLAAQAYRDGNQIMQDTTAFAQTVGTLGSETRHQVRDAVSSRPYLVLGAAATTGYVLGRGLTFSMGRTLLGFGGRMAINYMMRRVTQQVTAAL